MNTLLIFLAGLAATYLSARLAGRALSLADLVTGLLSGLAGLSLLQVLGAEHAPTGLGLPLVLVCGLALGLASLRQPASHLVQ